MHHSTILRCATSSRQVNTRRSNRSRISVAAVFCALFFVGYDSFAEWEKDNLAQQKNSTLSAALDKALVADGQLLTSYDAGVFTYREDLSLRPSASNVAQSRYFDIMRFKIRQGHDRLRNR